MLRGWRQLPRRARVAAILTDIIRREIVFAAANEARVEIQLDAVRPFGSSAFAPPVLLYGMADDLRADRARSVPNAATGRIVLCGGAGAGDRKSTRLNSSHRCISHAVFC